MAGTLRVDEIGSSTGTIQIEPGQGLDLSNSKSVRIPIGSTLEQGSPLFSGLRYDLDKRFLKSHGTSWNNIKESVSLNDYDNINKTGLILHLDAKNYNSYIGSGSTWRDVSKYHNNAIAYNGIDYNSEGYFEFTGATNGPHFRMNNASAVDLSEGTVGAWVRFDTIASNRVVVAYGGNNTDRGWLLQNENNTARKIGFTVWTDNSAFYQAYIGETESNLLVGEWIYLVGTYTRTTVNVYINGARKISLTKPDTSVENSGDFWIAGEVGRSTYFLDGGIAAVHVYNRALTEDEIYLNYRALRKRFE